MATKVDDHPFFCRAKSVAKSAWDTPEYLSEADWQLARDALAAATPEALHALLYAESARAEAFFYRVIGWSEGLRYMSELDFVQSTGWAGLNNQLSPNCAKLLRATPPHKPRPDYATAAAGTPGNSLLRRGRPP